MYISRKFLPSLFTILNAFCGFLSILSAAKGDYDQACYFILYAGLFDAVDGLAARLVKSSSDFGVELDSLSDVISFGLAPSTIIYYLFFNKFAEIGIVISSLIMIFSAIRLARFNVQLVGYEKDEFKGIPTPMSAITISTYILFYHNKILSEKTSNLVISTLSILLPVLMVSKFRYAVFPKPNIKLIKVYPIRFVLLLIGVALIFISKGSIIFIYCILYILSGFVNYISDIVKQKKTASHHL